MFIEVVTLLRFEITAGVGEPESKDFLTEGNGDHKERAGTVSSYSGKYQPAEQRTATETSANNGKTGLVRTLARHAVDKF